MSYTAAQLETILENYEADEPYEYTRSDGTIVRGDHHYESWDGLEERLDRAGSSIALADIGTLRLIENIGGEGEGDYAALIFTVTDATGNTRLFRKEGYYASFHGTDWDGTFAEVEAYDKTVTVTDYREIKSNG